MEGRSYLMNRLGRTKTCPPMCNMTDNKTSDIESSRSQEDRYPFTSLFRLSTGFLKRAHILLVLTGRGIALLSFHQQYLLQPVNTAVGSFMSGVTNSPYFNSTLGNGETTFSYILERSLPHKIICREIAPSFIVY